MEEFQDTHYCVQQFHDCRNLGQIKRAIQSADETWTEEFIEHRGLGAILDCLAVLGERNVDSLSDAIPRLEVVACLKAVMNCRYGLDCLVKRGGKEGSLVGKIALALNTDNMLLKIHLFLVLSAISKHSAEGLAATLDALDYYKNELCQRHRYSVLVQELSQTAEFPEYQATIMAFINYLLVSCGDLHKRMRLRSELSALDLTDILGIMRYSDNPALSEQVQLYEVGVVRDREEAAMPGGVDISDHQQLFSALFEKVFGTPNSTKLLSILQKMLLIDRDTPTGDIAWSGLERMTEGALKIYTDQQAERIATSEINSLRKAIAAEAVRREREAEKEAVLEDTSVPSGLSTTPPTTAAVQPPVPPPGAPPPPPPLFCDMKTVAAITSIFDEARSYKPKKRMKKLNWEKAPDYDARQSSAVWHRTSDVNTPVTVSVSERHIESLFCQRTEGTDGKFTGKSTCTKTHLPDQRKALNVNLVLGGMRRQSLDPDNPDHIKSVHMSNEEVLLVIRDGNSSAISLNQATILMEQAPNEKDLAFLELFQDDESGCSKLGRVEKFMLGLAQMPAYRSRLRVLRTKKVFEEIEAEYQPTFDLLHVAMHELMSSSSLRDLFYIILLTGNFINGNTKLGSAYGFKISSLPRLSTTLANVKKTTLNVNFLHFLVMVCEKDCPRLLKFHTELPHLDDASRVSVETIQEELMEWQKEIDELKEMMSPSSDVGLPLDFIAQLQEFVTVAEDTLSDLLGDLKSVHAAGRELAQYLCDDRDNFLESVFVEIKNFADEFSLTVKETMKEKPIWFSPEHVTAVETKPQRLSPQHATTTPSPKKDRSARGLTRATSIITEHVMDIPASLTPISEEKRTSRNDSTAAIPLAFPENGHVQGNGQHETDDISPPLTPASTAEIVLTDVEDVDFDKAGPNKPNGKVFVSEGKRRHSATQVPRERGSTLVHRKSSLRGPPPISRSKRHSVHELGHFSMLSRQTSWNDYKGHSPPLQRRGSGSGGNLERYPSADMQTIFDGSLDDVARLLHKMAEAIERDIGN